MARAAAALLALASAPQDISVPAAALALTAHAPTVEVTTDDGFLALVRKARPLQFARTVSRRTTWSGLTEPSLPPPANVEIDVPSASLTLTGYAPTVEVTDDLPDLLIPPRWSVRSVQRVAPRGGSASARWLMLLAPAGSPDVTVALTGQAVTVSPGTLTPANTQALAGTVVTASAGSLAVTASLALLGQAVTAAAGTPALSSTVALTGSAATVSAGTLTPVPTFALSGSAVTTSTGTLGVSSTLPLSGLSVEAQPGAITPNIAGDITIALVGQAVTVSAGTITAEVPAAPSEPQYARGGGGGRGFDAKEAARKRKRDEALEATIRQMYRELTQEPATAELAAEVVAPITAPTAAKIPSTASVAFDQATVEIELGIRMLHKEIVQLRLQREEDENEAREILEILDLID